MALTVSSIVGNVSGFLGNDKYNVGLQQKTLSKD